MFRPLLVRPAYPSSPFGGINQPVGIGCLAEILNQAGAEYEICDLQVETESQLFHKIASFAPSHIGLSLMSLDYDSHYSLISKIKQHARHIPIIVGGPHAAYIREAIFDECAGVDIIVFNEGEPFISDMLEGKHLEHIPGIAVRQGRDRITTPERKFVDDLDQLPFPRYAKFSLPMYGDKMDLITSRGCPFSCIFCGAHISMGRKWRSRSAVSVIHEIRYWYHKGYRRFNFVDSNFFMSHERVKQLCAGLNDLNLQITLSSDGMRANDYNEETLKIMKSYGLRHVAIGIESANEDILKRIKKGESLADIRRCMDGLQKLGIDVIAFFIVGLPGETVEHVFNSFDFALSYPGICNVFFFNPNPLEGTELYDICRKKGYLKSSVEMIRRNMGGMGDEIPISTPELPVTVRRELMTLSHKVKEAVKLQYNLYKQSHTMNSPKRDKVLKEIAEIRIEIDKMKINIREMVASRSLSQIEFENSPEFSVIIPTRNRAASLEQTLYSLCSIQNPGHPYEIIVVDNGSTDATRQVTELFKQALPQLKYVFEPNPGLHNGRHRGALEAKGQYLCYLDDDVKVDPLWLKSVAETFETTGAVLVGGKILPEYEQTPPDWVKEFVKPVGNYGYNIGQLTLIDLGEQIREIDPIYVWGANFSIRKDVLFECGGFCPDSMPKELLDLRGDGETGLSRAIKQKGYKAFYHPRAMVRHCISKDRLTVDYFCARMFNQGISDSFTEIRNAGKLPNPVVSAAWEAYQNGKIHHRRIVQNNPNLLSWITRKDYFSECQSKTPAPAIQSQQKIENKTVQMVAGD